MLEAIRRLGVERRWVFGGLLSLVTVTFIGSMGWMGLSGPTGAYAAKVNGEVVLLGDFQQAYRNVYMRYERQLGEQFNADMIKAMDLSTQVVMGLVDRKLWLSMARNLGVVASDAEVRDYLVGIPAFQANGRFNSRQYLDILKRLKTTPEAFEAGIRQDLVVQKVQSVVASAAELTKADLEDLKTPDGAEPPPDQIAQRRAGLLNRKRAQVVAAYTDHLRATAKIQIFRENIANLGLG